MPPKKGRTSASTQGTKKSIRKKATGSPLPKYKDLIVEAVLSLGERGGSSRQAIKKYIKDKYPVGTNFDGQFNLAVKRGLDAGELSQPKGPAGSIKLLKRASESVRKPISEKKVTKKKVATVKKISGKKVATVKKMSGKKVATSKAVAKKPAATKKAVTKKTTVISKKAAAGKRGSLIKTRRAAKRAVKST
ncbi:HHL047Cp [Eremothecium sinecaudum]|uniref:Histone H1 n=1 Tax=Eremothecium sinecaudum TaxID=45286 RepID=A0A109V0B5_9SACH|nr:HHL047Cp [Eremothecium sinecaudum]AMD22723.1 HHL047Cp [Eremothecium sinecaudum]